MQLNRFQSGDVNRVSAWIPGEVVACPDPAELALLDRLMEALELRDSTTASHLRRMAAVTGLLAERLGTPPQQAWMVRAAALLHDAGKLMVSSGILKKPGALDAGERAAMERHALVGHRILAGWDTPIFRLAATIALSHHERWDGEGYPLGLAGEDIPGMGRIAAVADVLDALLSERPYRAALPIAEAMRILREGRGSHFDPEVIDALFANVDEALEVRSTAGGDRPYLVSDRLHDPHISSEAPAPLPRHAIAMPRRPRRTDHADDRPSRSTKSREPSRRSPR